MRGKHIPTYDVLLAYPSTYPCSQVHISNDQQQIEFIVVYGKVNFYCVKILWKRQIINLELIKCEIKRKLEWN